MSGGMAWPAVGVVGGGEASATAQPATGGRCRRHDWRCFGRLEQEDQRLKKHDGHWMDIVRSLQLESFILTKLKKPLVRQLSRPTGQLPKRCAPDVRGRNHFLGVIRRHFLACGRGPSYQPLHVHYSFDGSRSLTTLTTPRREHQGGGRRRGLGRGRRGAGKT